MVDDDDDDEDKDEDEEEEEDPALADSVPPVYRMTARISIRDEPSISLPPMEEVERLLALTTPPPSPFTPLSSPLPQIPSPPLYHHHHPIALLILRFPRVVYRFGRGDDLVGANEMRCTDTLEGVNQGYRSFLTVVEQETTSLLYYVGCQDDRVHDFKLQSADHRRQRVITELLASDHKRQVQLTKTLRLLKGLQTQMVELQRQHGPAEGPSQPDAPGEASSSS
ncbi:hypothetical protein Tco_1191512 [Tanacetum coccineum]